MSNANENKVVFGLENVHYAIITETQEADGIKIEYGTPVPVPGAVNFAMDPLSELSDFHADNGVYYTTSNSQGHEGTLEVAKLPERFYKDVFRDIETEDGILVENLNVQPRKVAFLFEFSGDQKATRHCLTYCTVTRPSLNSSTTTDTAEPTTTEMTIKAAKRPTDGIAKFSTGSNTSEVVFENWYKEVQAVEINPPAPTAKVDGATGANNSGTKLVATFDRKLYANSVKLSNGDVKKYFTFNGQEGAYTSATYNEAAKTVTFVFGAGLANANTITATGLTGFNGAAVTDKYTYNATGTVWAKA